MHAGYLNSVFLDRSDQIKKICAKLRRVSGEFDAVAGIGMSGVIYAAEISQRLNKGLVLVRKKEDKSHSGREIECSDYCHKRIVFIDDLIASGDTFRFVKNKLEKYRMRMVGVILYHESWLVFGSYGPINEMPKGFFYTCGMEGDYKNLKRIGAK